MKNISSTLGIFAVMAVAVGLTACNPDQVAQNIVPTVLAQNADFTYETFTQERFDELKDSEAFSVFVHSHSCGTCAKKNNEIISEVNQFNDGAILKMEYDEAPQSFLAEYEVTKYDTFIIFDANGNHTTQKGALVDSVRSAIQ